VEVLFFSSWIFLLEAVTLVVVLTAVPASLSGQTKDSPAPVLPGQTEVDFIVKDFHFKSGEVLPELRLHYVTLGAPHRNSASSQGSTRSRAQRKGDRPSHPI
jgi:hypothetical protein